MTNKKQPAKSLRDQVYEFNMEAILKAMEELILRDKEKRTRLRKALNEMLDVPMLADEVEND
jgi:hypothetical protein